MSHRDSDSKRRHSKFDREPRLFSILLNLDYDDDDDDIGFTVLALRDIEEMENKIEKKRE
ncbi:hypothetical protein TSUD_47780 [Trifolium subterraneum]|nr:hypothetical protein TSUD_47780 [Trifolium subterraneum]